MEGLKIYEELWYAVDFTSASPDEPALEFTIYEVITSEEINPEPVGSGSIRFDGCSDITLQPLHFCGISKVREFSLLLEELYKEARLIHPLIEI